MKQKLNQKADNGKNTLCSLCLRKIQKMKVYHHLYSQNLKDQPFYIVHNFFELLELVN